MAQPLIGEIRIFAGNFAPAGWAFCDGSLQPISENEALFNLIGTTYGGDGQSTYGLPNLQSRVPIHQGQGAVSSFILAETGGAETVTLNANQMPQHNHAFLLSSDTGAQVAPADNVLGTGASVTLFRPLAPNQAMGTTTSVIGGSQPHENMQPYLVLNYIISLFGIFPPPS